MNAIADAIQPSALEALLTQTLADEAGLNDVAEGFKPILAYVASLASNQCVAETFHMFEWEKTCKAYLTPILADEEKCAAVTKKFMDESEKRVPKREVELDIPEGEGEILCNVEFKLAYGGKILLNTTHFHVRRGRIYGLLGHNGCGKSTLMRAISSGALAGFPGAEELMKLRACFVDHDIDGSDANTPTIDFCLQEPVLAPLGREKIREKLLEMEFTEELINKPICNLSGGWKMKLALARAVLLNADLLLLDEPTNHLDVQKQQWLCDFLTGPQCEHVTTLVVSHDSKFLNKVLSDVIHYENMRLKRYTGNLDQFVEQCPMAKAYFSIHDTEMKFTFPVPGPLEGVKSRTKAILQAKNITFTYPTYRDRVLYHLRRPIGATVARQIPVLKVTCSTHVSVTPATRAQSLTRTSPTAVPLLPEQVPQEFQPQAQPAQGALDQGLPQGARQGDGRGPDLRAREAAEPAREVRPGSGGGDPQSHGAGPGGPGEAGRGAPQEPHGQAPRERRRARAGEDRGARARGGRRHLRGGRPAVCLIC